jgi:hypothetical protein
VAEVSDAAKEAANNRQALVTFQRRRDRNRALDTDREDE